MNKNILIGVTGSIASYKICDLIVKLKALGFNCFVVLTKSASKFINKLTFEILTNNLVLIDETWFEKGYVQHIDIIKKINYFLIAPATANTISKIAFGIADNLLTTIAISLNENTLKFFAPAMNTNMYQNIQIQKNINYLEDELGFVQIKPQKMLLACGDFGNGGLADIDEIIKKLQSNE